MNEKSQRKQKQPVVGEHALRTNAKYTLKRVLMMLGNAHTIELGLIIVAMLVCVLFVVLHLLMVGMHLWWMLAVATIFLGISDLIMRIRRHH